METAFVISLARRPERLARFQRHFSDVGLATWMRLETLSAVDGRLLVFDDALQARIRPSNLTALDDGRLRGIVGCALSHLEVWRLAALAHRPTFVFEDDARLIDARLAPMVASAIDRMPHDVDLVWLSDYMIDARCTWRYRLRQRLQAVAGATFGSGVVGNWLRPRRVRFAPMPDVLATAEAYLIRPAFAAALYEATRNDLGAADRHLMQFASRSGAGVRQAEPPLFTQSDRSDSDTLG
jgi:GR25 family glycosyltransferase involved in LPS biosynthesis